MRERGGGFHVITCTKKIKIKKDFFFPSNPFLFYRWNKIKKEFIFFLFCYPVFVCVQFYVFHYPRTFVSNTSEICFLLRKMVCFLFYILFSSILFIDIWVLSSRGTSRCENRQVVANCAIIPRNLIFIFFLFFYIIIYISNSMAKKREVWHSTIRQYPQKNYY